MHLNYKPSSGYNAVGFAPNTPATQAVIAQFQTLMPVSILSYHNHSHIAQGLANFTYHGFDTEAQINDLIYSTDYSYLFGSNTSC